MILEKIEPQKVFEIFEKISQIPHGSYNVSAISDWIAEYAKEHNLSFIQDEDKNIIVVREASAGYENVPTMMLQGHIDMVCAKENDVDIDFLKDPLDLYIDGDFLKARGTTLGADDGVFVAYALAILTDEDLHVGRIEAVFTVNEEVGLLGASSIDASNLSGKYMINIDSNEEDSIIVSCAGGQDAELKFNYEKVPCDLPSYILEVGGLNGGHSGEQINQGLANANKVLFDVLARINIEFMDNKFPLRISSIEGGVADNVIPSSAKAVLLMTDDEFNIARDIVVKEEHKQKINYYFGDRNISLSLEKCDYDYEYAFDDTTILNIIKFVGEAPNGVVKMSEDIDGLVETSLNLGIVSTDSECISFTYSIRSSIDAKKKEVFAEITELAHKFSGKAEDLGGYPGWEFNKESELRPIFEKIYRETYGKELEIKAIHAGLECGIFAGKIKNLDCVSMGPNVYDLHTTKERLSISSAKRTYDFLKNVLKCFSEEMKNQRG